MYAERNSRLLCQGPASDRTHRFSAGGGRSAISRFGHVSARHGVDDQSLRGQPFLAKSDFPRDHPLAVTASLRSPRTRRASPLLAGLSADVTASSGNSITRQGISLP